MFIKVIGEESLFGCSHRSFRCLLFRLLALGLQAQQFDLTLLLGEIPAALLAVLLDSCGGVTLASTFLPTCLVLFLSCSGAALIGLTSLFLVLLLAFTLLAFQNLPKDRLCHHLVHLLLKVGDLVRRYNRANFSLWCRCLDDHAKFFVLVF